MPSEFIDAPTFVLREMSTFLAIAGPTPGIVDEITVDLLSDEAITKASPRFSGLVSESVWHQT